MSTSTPRVCSRCGGYGPFSTRLEETRCLSCYNAYRTRRYYEGVGLSVPPHVEAALPPRYVPPPKGRMGYRELKTLCLSAYGGRCVCCGEDGTCDHCGKVNDRWTLYWLTIDHKVPRALGERRVSGREFMASIVREGYPSTYQVLCRPCNASKGRGEGCRIDHSQDGNIGEEGPEPLP